MIFTGDIAQPYNGASNYNVPHELKEKCWFGNLEGSVIQDSTPGGVYNTVQALESLCRDFHFKAFGIANNHLLYATDVPSTIAHMGNMGVPVVGGGGYQQQ